MRIAFGIMGGWNQAQAHAQFVSNVVDFGMNLQGALDAPRFSKETFAGCDVNFESRIPETTRNELTAHGPQDRHARRLLVDAHGLGAGGDARLRHEA